MANVSKNNAITVKTENAAEFKQILLDWAASQPGVTLPDMGEVEDVISATFQTTNMTSPIVIDLNNNTEVVLTLVDREGDDTTPVV